MRSIVPLVVLTLAFAATIPAAARERLVTTSRGTCLTGPHDPMRIRRLPGTAVTTDRPRNPQEEAYVHCREAEAEEAPPSRDGR